MADEIRYDARVVRGLVSLSGVIGWLVLLSSVVLLASTIHGVPVPAGFMPEHVTPRIGAALCAAFSGAALVLFRRSRDLSVLLCLVVLTIAINDLFAATIGDAASGQHWIDKLLARDGGQRSARMTELAAVGFSLIAGTGLLISLNRFTRLRYALALPVLVISMTSSASYGIVLAGETASLLRRLPIITASGMLLLVIGWLAAVPNAGPSRIIAADSQGGMLARRLLLPSLLLPVVLAFVFEFARSQFGISESMALVLAAVSTGCIIAALITWVAILLDRSERERRAVRILRADATTDALTGLTNRRGIDTEIARSIDSVSRGIPTAFLIVDLDHFKSFNDSFGHHAGDEVLRISAQLFRDSVRPHDLVARFGGEEFVILLPECDSELALTVANRILESFRSHGWIERAVTVSIGVTTILPTDTPETLLLRADNALYQSKNTGRDRLTIARDPVPSSTDSVSASDCVIQPSSSQS